MHGKKTIRVAILDLYEGVANEGMRCIREILNQYAEISYKNIVTAEFDVRLRNEAPDLSYDIYISSGGPGSPLESENSIWENHYFKWLKLVEDWNNNQGNEQKKYIFFICHSFQLACRHYKVANVSKRKSTSFGVFPVHMLLDGKDEPVFDGLKDPFYAVDSRDYQVTQPDHHRIMQMGGKILCIEKERPHVPLERAVMSIRFNEYMIGTQFHPEADPEGMTMYLQREDKKKTVIENHGVEKWQSMIDHLNDPDKILWTHSHILPNFLSLAIENVEEAAA
ncbi:MAG: GMP synthase [Chitinophagaceae bacterium]|nr:GMP synthase [Chitinophagaceae bacterium]